MVGSKVNRGDLVALALLAAVTLASCPGSDYDKVPVVPTPREERELITPPYSTDLVMYIPFVEEVVVPEAILEYEPFQIAVRVSAQFRPAVLRGYPYWRKHPDDNDGIADYDEFSISPMPEGSGYDGYIMLGVTLAGEFVTGTGTVLDRFVFDFPSGLPAGKYLLWTSSMRERRAGGAGVIWRSANLAGGDAIVGEVGTKAIEMDLTVLPAEDTGEK